MTTGAELIEKLRTAAAQIATTSDAKKKNTLWKAAYAALQKTDLPSVRVQNVVAKRSLPELQQLIDQLAPAAAPPPSGPDQPPVDPELLKSAIRAFKKRLKLTRLDDESRLTVKPLTSGGKSEIQSILPPHGFDKPVWDELVRQGRLRYTGQGFYEYLGQLGEE